MCVCVCVYVGVGVFVVDDAKFIAKMCVCVAVSGSWDLIDCLAVFVSNCHSVCVCVYVCVCVCVHVLSIWLLWVAFLSGLVICINRSFRLSYILFQEYFVKGWHTPWTKKDDTVLNHSPAVCIISDRTSAAVWLVYPDRCGGSAVCEKPLPGSTPQAYAAGSGRCQLQKIRWEYWLLCYFLLELLEKGVTVLVVVVVVTVT